MTSLDRHPYETIAASTGLGNFKLFRRATNAANNDIAVADTVETMVALVSEYAQHPIVLAAVREALLQVPVNEEGQKLSQYQQARAIYYWVKRNVQYVADESRVDGNRELLFTPDALLAMEIPSGDCDDYSLLIACMLKSVDIPGEFIVIAADPNYPGELSHIYVCVETESGKVMMDASHGSWFGWEAPKHMYSRKVAYKF